MKSYITGMVAALLLASCSGDEDYAAPAAGTAGTEGVARALNIAARTAGGLQLDAFTLMLFDTASGSVEVAETHQMTWDAARGLWLENGRLPQTTIDAPVMAAYAGGDGWWSRFEGGSSSVYISYYTPTDQSDAETLQKIDNCLFGIPAGTDEDGNPALTFYRPYAKLVFKVTKSGFEGTGRTGELTDVKINKVPGNIGQLYYFDDPEPNCVVPPGLVTISCYYDEANGTITAYIVAVSTASSMTTDFYCSSLTFNVDGISRTATLPYMELHGGRVYTFSLSVSPKEATATVAGSAGNALPGWDENSETEL